MTFVIAGKICKCSLRNFDLFMPFQSVPIPTQSELGTEQSAFCGILEIVQEGRVSCT